VSYCSCDWGDSDTVQMWDRKDLKVRKPCVCRECHRTIAAGELVRSDAYLWEGKWYRDRTCKECVAFEEWMTTYIPCFADCLPFGELWGQADEAVADLWRETAGLKFGYLRRRHTIMTRAKADREARRKQKELVAA
jgi:hypothetical protein